MSSAVSLPLVLFLLRKVQNANTMYMFLYFTIRERKSGTLREATEEVWSCWVVLSQFIILVLGRSALDSRKLKEEWDPIWIVKATVDLLRCSRE